MGQKVIYSIKELASIGGVVLKLIEKTDATAGTSGHSHADPQGVMPFKEANFFLNVTAIAGATKTLDVKVVSKDPSADKWHQVVAFTQATDITAEMKIAAANLGENIAIEYTKNTATVVTFTVYAVVKIR